MVRVVLIVGDGREAAAQARVGARDSLVFADDPSQLRPAACVLWRIHECTALGAVEPTIAWCAAHGVDDLILLAACEFARVMPYVDNVVRC